MAPDPNKLTQFWTELKRRKVFRVMAMYAATAFIIMEAGDIMLPRLGLPDWTVTFIIVLLIIGFPISIILSWIFDITPEGVKKTESIDVTKEQETPSVSIKRRQRLSDVVIVILIVVVGILAYPKIFKKEKVPELGKSIAVLPFKNLSENPEQIYFVEGMHDGLISDLSGINTLKVISRTSMMRYQDTKKSIPEIARELNVDILIEGSVLRIGDKIRINAQLIDGLTDLHLWAEQYDYQLQDAMSLISKVTRDIATEINIVLTPKEKERLINVQAVNPVALEYYMKGRNYYYKMSLEANMKARDFFQKAIEVDANFAKAYVDLANCYSMFAWYGAMSKQEASLMVYQLLGKAFQLDDQLAESHQALATWKFYHEWDFPGAKKEFMRSFEINPNLAGNSEYSLYLASMRRFEEAIPEAKRVLRLDPFSNLPNLIMILVYSLADRNNEAMEQNQKMLELGLVDSSEFYYNMQIFNVRMGMYDKAVKARKKYMTLRGSSPELIESLEQAYKKSGPEGYWLWRLNQLKGKYDKYPLQAARIFTYLGEKGKALDYLEMAYQKHERMLYMLYAHPDWIPLREEVRYQALIDKMGFEK